MLILLTPSTYSKILCMEKEKIETVCSFSIFLCFSKFICVQRVILMAFDAVECSDGCSKEVMFLLMLRVHVYYQVLCIGKKKFDTLFSFSFSCVFNHCRVTWLATHGFMVI